MKCGCGCNMVTVKEEGGKMSSKCACNCGGKMKHQKGGQINNKKSNNMKENLGSIQSILDSFKKGGVVQKKQIGGIALKKDNTNVNTFNKKESIKTTPIQIAHEAYKETGGRELNTSQEKAFSNKSQQYYNANSRDNDQKEYVKKRFEKKQNGGDLSPKALTVKQKGGKAPQRVKSEPVTIYTASSATSKLPKMNSQSGANSTTEKPKLAKKAKGGAVKPTIYTAASATSKLPKMNAQSGANSSTVPTNPDGSAKAPNRIKKGQEGFATKTLVKPKPKKNVLPVVNGKKVPNDGADYSVQGPANKSEKVNKNKK